MEVLMENKDVHMNQDEWWSNFTDDPCDDISGDYLHLWTKKQKDIQSE